MCKESRNQWESEMTYHPWIETYRHLFKLDVLSPEKPLEDWLDETPEHFLPAMRYMNMVFEGSGAKCMSLVPLRRTFRPGFYGIDTKGLKEALHLQSTNYIKERLKPLLYSSLVPGLGQYYNGKETKALIFLGMEIIGFIGYWIYWIYWQNLAIAQIAQYMQYIGRIGNRTIFSNMAKPVFSQD